MAKINIKYDYLLVGAGLYNGVIAHELISRGRSVLVAERRDHIGGNLYMDEMAGIHIHTYGPHVFHTDDREVWDYVNALTGFNSFINSPLASYKGRLYHLPFNMNTFYEIWGTRTPGEALDKIAAQRAAAGICGEPANLEEQALSLVGEDIYRILIKGYSEKQWGRNAEDLPAFIIKRLPLRFTFDNNYFDSKYQGIPAHGYNELIDKLFEGARIITGTDYLKARDELRAAAERVVYTGPVDEYFGCCYGALKYRTLRFETEILDIPDYQGNAIVNYTEREVPYTRIIEHKHFEHADTRRTVITREYPKEYEPGDEPYYPINDAVNDALYERYRELSRGEKGVYFGGRLGSYRYLDMDKTVRAALDMAAEL